MAITPYVLYEDAGAAIAWLAKAFGFRKSGPPMKGPDGRVWHADLELGEHAILLGGPGGSYRSPKRSGAATVLMYVDVDDAAKCYRRAVKAGAKVIEEPTDTAYGARRFGVEDPEGPPLVFRAAARGRETPQEDPPEEDRPQEGQPQERQPQARDSQEKVTPLALARGEPRR